MDTMDLALSNTLFYALLVASTALIFSTFVYSHLFVRRDTVIKKTLDIPRDAGPLFIFVLLGLPILVLVQTIATTAIVTYAWTMVSGSVLVAIGLTGTLFTSLYVYQAWRAWDYMEEILTS